MYSQLVQPNLSVVGDIGYCLKYADNVAGLSHGEQTAWIAWNNTQFPHTDPIPTDVDVPCWFSYYLNGVNLGHVVWSIKGTQFYSSPYNKPTGHNVMSSIAEVERLYGVKYVGWSEDISGLIVIQQEEQMDKVTEEVSKVLQFALLGRNGLSGRPNALTGATGTPWVGAELNNTFINDIFATPEAVQYRQDAKIDSTIPGVNRRLAGGDTYEEVGTGSGLYQKKG